MITPAFTDPARQAAVAFRAALDAMSRPGTIVDVPGPTPPAPLSVAAGALILTLCDLTTSLWLAPEVDTDQVRTWITFHTGASFVPAAEAAFAVGPWDAMGALSRFPQGRADYPDQSATLIVEMPALTTTGARLTGPGIRNHAHLSVPDAGALAANHAQFPCGVDVFFCCGARLAAVPRTTRVEAA